MIYMCGGEVEEERQDDKGDVVKDVIKFEETTGKYIHLAIFRSQFCS